LSTCACERVEIGRKDNPISTATYRSAVETGCAFGCGGPWYQAFVIAVAVSITITITANLFLQLVYHFFQGL